MVGILCFVFLVVLLYVGVLWCLTCLLHVSDRLVGMGYVVEVGYDYDYD